VVSGIETVYQKTAEKDIKFKEFLGFSQERNSRILKQVHMISGKIEITGIAG